MKNMEETHSAKPSILIVDDTHANLHFLTKILTMQDYTVRPVSDGLLAVTSAKAAPPDLILLDVMMPGLTGYEVCEQLKADEHTRDIPVIFISVKSEIPDKVKALSSGGVDYMTKPFNTEELLARVKIHLTLRQLQKTLQEKNARLEQEMLRRQQAEHQLSATNRELEETSQSLEQTHHHLAQSEKMTELGQLAASIAHELNSPLGVIHSSADYLATSLHPTFFEEWANFFHALSDSQQQDFLALLQQASRETRFRDTKEKREIRKRLTDFLEKHQVEAPRKTADLLTSVGIYENIHSCLSLLSDPDHLRMLTMANKVAGLQKSASTLTIAIEKAMKIIQALKNYARYDTSGEMVRANLARGLEMALTLYHNKLKQGIEVHQQYERVPPVLCYPDELLQVWTNLINNAVYAMRDGGMLTIALSRQNEYAVVAISDTGHGISDENKAKIFEPFFTTKPRGEGNGLGLDIVKKIIAKHQGTITVESQPGNTTFYVSLPLTL